MVARGAGAGCGRGCGLRGGQESAKGARARGGRARAKEHAPVQLCTRCFFDVSKTGSAEPSSSSTAYTSGSISPPSSSSSHAGIVLVGTTTADWLDLKIGRGGKSALSVPRRARPAAPVEPSLASRARRAYSSAAEFELRLTSVRNRTCALRASVGGTGMPSEPRSSRAATACGESSGQSSVVSMVEMVPADDTSEIESSSVAVVAPSVVPPSGGGGARPEERATGSVAARSRTLSAVLPAPARRRSVLRFFLAFLLGTSSLYVGGKAMAPSLKPSKHPPDSASTSRSWSKRRALE